MAKFRKKPIVIGAEQFWPDQARWPQGVVSGRKPDGVEPCFYILTLEGWFEVSPGDWIITGIKGERYPVRDDIFRETHESVEE